MATDPPSFGGGGAQARRAVSPGRWAALRAIETQCKRYPNVSAVEIDDRAMDARDGALAHAIYEQTMRRWITLGWVLDRYSNGPTERMSPSVRAALMGGTTQLLFMDRVPVHAAINESVEWVKRRASRKAGGLVNAVLRRVGELAEVRETTEDPAHVLLGDGRWLRLGDVPEAEGFASRTSLATGVPSRLVKRWAKAWGEERAWAAAAQSVAPAATVLNTAYADGVAGEADCVPHAQAGHSVFTGDRAALLELLARRRDLWVQDVSSARAVALASDLKPALIVDWCAGLGTKTMQLASVFPGANVLATDVNRERFETLRSVFEGHEQVEAIAPEELRERALGRADLVLLDVPCTNTGVLARRVEAMHRFGGKSVAELNEIQRQIVVDTIPLLARGARVVYATCSLEAEENEGMVRWMSKWHPLKEEGRAESWPRGAPGGPATEHEDGAFAARMVWGG